MPNQLKHDDLAAVRPSERAPFTAAFSGDQAAAAFAERHPPRQAVKTADDFATLVTQPAAGGIAR